MLAGWGVKSVSVVNGGLDGLVKAGGQLASGPMTADIPYVREMEKGEIGVDEFRKVLREGTAHAVILDVRSADEVADGAFPGRLPFLLTSLPKRWASCPRINKS